MAVWCGAHAAGSPHQSGRRINSRLGYQPPRLCPCSKIHRIHGGAMKLIFDMLYVDSAYRGVTKEGRHPSGVQTDMLLLPLTRAPGFGSLPSAAATRRLVSSASGISNVAAKCLRMRSISWGISSRARSGQVVVILGFVLPMQRRTRSLRTLSPAHTPVQQPKAPSSLAPRCVALPKRVPCCCDCGASPAAILLTAHW